MILGRRKGYPPLVLTVLTLSLLACTPEKSARDSIAIAKGIIEASQAQYMPVCNHETGTNPEAGVCSLINDGVDAQNLAIDALELYCGSGLFYDEAGPCQPNKEYGPRLRAALARLNDITASLKSLLKKE